MNKLLQVPEKFLRSKGVKHPEYVIYGALAVGAIIAFLIIRRQIKLFFGTAVKKVDKHVVTTNTTITKDDAKSIADRIWLLLNSNFFVSFSSVIEIFDGYPNISTGDLTMIYNAFGIRNNGFPLYTKGDLYFWLDRKIKFGRDDAKVFFGI